MLSVLLTDWQEKKDIQNYRKSGSQLHRQITKGDITVDPTKSLST